MSESKRDQNMVTAALAVQSDDGVTPIPIYVEPITGRIQVTLTGSVLPATASPTGRRDANSVPVVYGVTDDVNETPVPIAMDDDGNIIVDVILG